MKITAKARLIKASSDEMIRPIMLVQEKLARTRLLQQLVQLHRPLIDAINNILSPLLRQGHSAVSSSHLTEPRKPIIPEHYYAWFILKHQQNILGYWRIDRCTLDQLASNYYGSMSTPLNSPLRDPSQSEFRLARKLLLSVVDKLPNNTIDTSALEVELIKGEMELAVSAVWSFNFSQESQTPPMLFCLTEHLLGHLAEQPKKSEVSADLPAKLAIWLKNLPVKIQVTLGQHNIPVHSLGQLNTGDILPINLYPKTLLSIGSTPLFHATVHSHEGLMVAKLTQDVYQYEENDIG
ncbi:MULTISPECIES: FliM/FliN family flagellar motor switch protein [unclassified Shewanella]|jgi:flagellar motor switch/type III secretory pathway protein FliN|uniref:FliM/FliN family flagellar motor switch protein n=1 Tax=unclassified Shewanella TaxID=196818 RepID=UPI0020065EC2|nr:MULTISPECIES: FliM/FliN family flagellar motor C-terminal domain-containing protein [unclassified Shewanella]MCK7635504.1 FliM/FliN family flagellar motor C-terminal domain-containing protein [Shewanella sp. JNE17]MCK7650730.1 FliM/FliN family flagellar motor C-terminal domain-containing protein [Shewanella sp. JNE8]MCK7658911.1 FliM/FliN family flagellar motor C-terminal domain-containing protein [Shewanella sp. JNE4-2]UPO30945.1 FliM/FliN family flagellar motor C-terminal domain-containing